MTYEKIKEMAAVEEAEKLAQEEETLAAAAVALGPKVQEMLEEMAGEEQLKKPWNAGKAARAAADLIELASVTSEIRRNKMASTYSLPPSPSKQAGGQDGGSDGEGDGEEAEADEGAPGVDLSLVSVCLCVCVCVCVCVCDVHVYMYIYCVCVL